ncbi:MAG: zinc-dependent metalloprotease [Actinobacteria bacterium]|nr:zinc-dependent metalloprotease [Actinomycetota bacterium]
MSHDPMGDIPLFREIQKILASSQGPINLEIARQVANALNQDASDHIDADAAGVVADAVREAEFVVAGYTRVPIEEPARSEVITRRQWVNSTIAGWTWLLNHIASRFSSEVSSFASGRGDDVNPMGTVMGQIAPLLLGMQAGTLIGQLARDALGRYDPGIPRDDDAHLFFVVSTVDSVAHEYGLDRDTFRRWLVLDDVARHTIARATPWADRYRRSLFVELIDSLEIDASDLERRLADLQSRGPEALQEGFDSGEMLPLVQTPRHAKALEVLRAFTAIFEGYSRHVARAVGPQFVGDTVRIEEGMRRREASPTEGRAMLRAMLGMTLDPALDDAGVTFCNAVVELRGVAALNAIWEAPDNLPTLAEIRDPFQWIERVLDE